MIYTLLRVLLLDFIHKLECSRKLIFLHLVSHWIVTLDTHVEIKTKKKDSEKSSRLPRITNKALCTQRSPDDIRYKNVLLNKIIVISEDSVIHNRSRLT